MVSGHSLSVLRFTSIISEVVDCDIFESKHDKCIMSLSYMMLIEKYSTAIFVPCDLEEDDYNQYKFNTSSYSIDIFYVFTSEIIRKLKYLLCMRPKSQPSTV